MSRRRTALPVYLDRQDTASHRTNTSWSAVFGNVRSTAASAFARRTRRPGKRWAQRKEILPVAEIMQRLVAETEAALSAEDFR